jgi:hypothetical protein
MISLVLFFRKPGVTPHEMKSIVVVWTCDDDQASILGKEEKEKQNGLKAKVTSIGPFCFR